MKLDKSIKISPFLIMVGVFACYRLSPIIGGAAIVCGVLLFILESKYKPGEIEETITKKHAKLIYSITSILTLIFGVIFFTKGALAYVPIMLYFFYTQVKNLIEIRNKNT